MKILVLNAGSSSLKFDVFESDPEHRLTGGTIERVTDMTGAVASVFDQLDPTGIAAVGHRVVHGGDQFTESVIIDPAVENAIDVLSALAPLHNPNNLEACRAARTHLPLVPHVAVFDTAFHHTIPPHAYTYGLPWEYLTKKKIRRYGFHGISHRSVSLQFAELTGNRPEDVRLITCHLGNGCSVCAIDKGKSIDTSMGFTPLEGLMMGTRSGDVDPGAILHLITHERIKPDNLLRILNNKSGLKGLSGVSNDMRDILAAAGSGNERATLAIDAFAYRVRKYIGAYLAAMNGADALLFTGGIGENSPFIRQKICQNLHHLGIELDSIANLAEGQEARWIGNAGLAVWVIPAKEERLIARDTLHCILSDQTFRSQM